MLTLLLCRHLLHLLKVLLTRCHVRSNKTGGTLTQPKTTPWKPMPPISLCYLTTSYKWTQLTPPMM
uniref:Uncharacterized protein n=1 Tax=uncultured marine virus TaxID=186617 RepID=A0A0F7L5V5_9VIRU|nr:hypothetical protein [uncultured marine virus]